VNFSTTGAVKEKFLLRRVRIVKVWENTIRAKCADVDWCCFLLLEYFLNLERDFEKLKGVSEIIET